MNGRRTTIHEVCSEWTATLLSSVQLGSFPVRGQPKAVKPKMRGRKLIIAVHWQGALQQQGVKRHKIGATCNRLKPSGYLSTNCLTFSNSKFSPHSVFVCFVWVWEQTAFFPSTTLTAVFSNRDLTIYSPVVTICTTSLTLKNSTFCPHNVFVCFVWVWEKTGYFPDRFI